jgi:hypothetical protein
MMVDGGFNPIGFIAFFITRAVFADMVSSLFLGIQATSRSKTIRDLVLAMPVFGIPIISFDEILRSFFGIFIQLPLPPYASFIHFTLALAMLYEFPRLLIFLAIKRFLNNMSARTHEIE